MGGAGEVEEDKDGPVPQASRLKLTGKAGVEESLLGGVDVGVVQGG